METVDRAAGRRVEHEGVIHPLPASGQSQRHIILFEFIELRTVEEQLNIPGEGATHGTMSFGSHPRQKRYGNR